jgi:uncharacterized RDD family membrane protein YckC
MAPDHAGTAPTFLAPGVGEVLLSAPAAPPLLDKLSPTGKDSFGSGVNDDLPMTYTRRRAGMRGRFDARSNIKLEFDPELKPAGRLVPKEDSPLLGKVDLDFNRLRPSAPGASDPAAMIPEAPRQPSKLQPRRTIDLEAPPVSVAKPQTRPVQPKSALAERELPRLHPPVLEQDSDLPVASASQRLAAGLADGAVILVCFGIFAGIFYVSGGHLHPLPSNLAILALLVSLVVFAYFGTFTAITHATPGGQWMGIAIRNLEGENPTTGQALLRAFGYLVAAAAFMLGFLWILMDSAGMGWHDHMSGTLPLALTRNSR